MTRQGRRKVKRKMKSVCHFCLFTFYFYREMSDFFILTDATISLTDSGEAHVFCPFPF